MKITNSSRNVEVIHCDSKVGPC